MNLRSHTSQLLFAGALLAFYGTAEGNAVPSGFPVQRYTTLWEHSPFTISSVQADTPIAGFAEKLVLVGIAKIGQDDMITVVNRDSQERMILDSSKPNAQGLKVVAVDRNPDHLKASVTIQKGQETAKVKFDKALLVSAQTAAAPAAGQPMAQTPQSPQPVQSMVQSPQPVTGQAPPVPVSARVRRILPIPAPYSGQPGNINTPPITPGAQPPAPSTPPQ